MTDKKKPYNLLHVREYGEEGSRKSVYTRIGVAFEIEGGFSLQIDEGLALTGRALILPKKADEPQG